MQFHAEHSLFFERRPSDRRATWSFGLVIAVLIVNAGVHRVEVSLVGAAIGVGLILVAPDRNQGRARSLLVWTAIVVACAGLGSIAVHGTLAGIVQTAARIACGVIWVLWLGTQIDWSSLRQIMFRLRVPEFIVAAVDHALLHGILTQREWTHQRDAARLRRGCSRVPLAVWGPLLGEGALRAFFRLEHVEQHARLRSSPEVRCNAQMVVRLEAVDVERRGRSILERVDLDVGRREWILLCGRSGAGKSSLLRVVAGLDGPTRGSMTRFGRLISPDTPLRARMDGRAALLAQNPEHHFIASTVAEDIAWGLRRRDVPSDEAARRSSEMAKELGVHHLLSRPCHELSFGEQRRVALAGLLVLEPSLLLLDEPTAGLDPVASHELRSLVTHVIRRTGAACIWATHDLHALPSRAERIVLLRDRRIVFDGSTVEGLSTPRLVEAGLAISPDRSDCEERPC